VGQANEALADFLQEVPAPAGLNAAQVAQFSQAIGEQVAQIRAKARETYLACTVKAYELNAFNRYLKGCISQGKLPPPDRRPGRVLENSSSDGRALNLSGLATLLLGDPAVAIYDLQQVGVDELDGDEPVERDVHAQVDRAEAAAAEPRHQPVAALDDLVDVGVAQRVGVGIDHLDRRAVPRTGRHVRRLELPALAADVEPSLHAPSRCPGAWLRRAAGVGGTAAVPGASGGGGAAGEARAARLDRDLGDRLTLVRAAG